MTPKQRIFHCVLINGYLYFMQQFVLLYNLACASAVCEMEDLLSVTRALQLYRIESQHPPRHPPAAINAQDRT